MEKKFFYLPFLVLVILLFNLYFNNENNQEKSTVNKVANVTEHVESNYNEITDFASLDNVIKQFIQDKIRHHETNINEAEVNDNLISEYLIHQLINYENSNPTQVIRDYCILFQYCETHNSETIAWRLNNFFYKNPKSVIDVLSDIDNYLSENFKNQNSLEAIYSSACAFPPEVTEEVPDFDLKNENKKMRDNLLTIKNNENSRVVDYLINNIFNEQL